MRKTCNHVHTVSNYEENIKSCTYSNYEENIQSCIDSNYEENIQSYTYSNYEENTQSCTYYSAMKKTCNHVHTVSNLAPRPFNLKMAWNFIRSEKIPEKGRTTCVCQSQIITSILKALPHPTLFKGTTHFSWFPTPSWVLSTKSQTNGFGELSAHSLFGKSHRLTNLNTPVQVGTSPSPFLSARSNTLLSVLKPQSNVFPASFFFHTPHLTQQRVYTSPPCSTRNSFLKQFFVLPFSSQCSADSQTHSNRNQNRCTNTEFQQVLSPVSSLAPFLYTFAHIFSTHTSICIHWNQHQLSTSGLLCLLLFLLIVDLFLHCLADSFLFVLLFSIGYIVWNHFVYLHLFECKQFEFFP